MQRRWHNAGTSAGTGGAGESHLAICGKQKEDRAVILNATAQTERAGAGPGAVGLPGATRTPDTQFRKLLLYPSELQGDVCLRHTGLSLSIMP